MAEGVVAEVEVSTNMEEPERSLLTGSLWTFCPKAKANFSLKDVRSKIEDVKCWVLDWFVWFLLDGSFASSRRE